MTEPTGAVTTVEDSTDTSAITGTTEAQEVTADGTTNPNENAGTEAKAAEAAKPTGPTQEEIDAAVANFRALIQGTQVLDDEGNPVLDADGNPTYKGDGVLDDPGRDTSSGHLSDELKNKIKAAYVALPGGTTKTSARPQVREYVDGLLAHGMDVMDVPLARTAFIIQSECLTARGSTGPTVAKVEVSPTEAHIARVVALYLSPYLVAQPDGLDEDWGERATAQAQELMEGKDGKPSVLEVYATWLHADPETRGEEPQVPDEVKAAGRIATGKAVRTSTRAKKDGESGTSTRSAYTGAKRDIAKHVEEFFATKDAGYVALLGEIAKFNSSEYPNGDASPGAVAARIYPGDGKPSNLPGVEQASKDGKKAARWVGKPAA